MGVMRPHLDVIGNQGDTPRGRPSWLVTLVVTTLGVALIVIIVQGWRTGAWGPAPANGSQGRKVPAHVSIREALETARKHLAENAPGKAEVVLREAVLRHAEDQELRVAFGETLMALRNFPEAYEQYVAALAIGPRDPGVEFAAGTLASQIGKPDRALEHYAAAQAADPKNADYPLYLAQVQLNQNQIDAAKANLMLAARLDPERAIVWGTLAEIAVRENKVNIALQHVARARELQPKVGTWRVIEARALKRKGDVEPALLVLKGMDVAERRQEPVLRLIAECYGMLDRPADAAAAYADASDAAVRDGALAHEAATWFARAGDTERATFYALRAKQNGEAQAAKLLERLGK